ncbi:MAG: macro domain-containing protein, partial [Thermodesulfovibrionales bacterium]|nr:macro domain-containing protein [Thermodesulfovibrionales bacterium]
NIQVRQGDILQEPTEVIVNAANEYLQHGGGLAGAIVKRGGSEIQKESDEWVSKYGKVSTGQVAVTGAGSLSARYIIHAVGPVWKDGNFNEPMLLASAVKNTLLKADELNVSSLSMPAISSGIFGFPKDRCTQIIVKTIYEFFNLYPNSSIKELRLTTLDNSTAELFKKSLMDIQISQS